MSLKILRIIAVASALAIGAASALAQQAPAKPAVESKDPVAQAPDSGRVMIEIYRIAPGQHEAFLRALARYDEVNVAAGLPPRQLYVHSDGASWDFLLIQPAEYPPGAGEKVAAAAEKLGMARGVRFFLEIRQFIAEHTDTLARGPTTAKDYLALMD